jgi:hypothetical protein
MAFDEVAPVFDAAFTLDGGHNEATEKAQEAQQKRYGKGLQGAERREAMHGGSEQAGRDHASSESFDGLFRTQGGGDGVFAAEFAPDILQDIAALNHSDKEKHEASCAHGKSFPRDAEIHEHRDMADEIHTDHQTPLGAGIAGEELRGVSPDHGQDRDQHKGIDRNHDAEHSIPVRVHEPVLVGQDQEEGDKESSMIRPSRGGRRDELPQGEERDEEKYDQGSGAPDCQSAEENQHHDPPAVGPGVQVGDGGLARLRFCRAGQDETDQAGRDQHTEDREQHMMRDGRGEVHSLVIGMWHQVDHGLFGSCQKLLFLFAFLQSDRSSENDGAQQRNGQQMTFGQDAVEVLQIDWDQFGLRDFLRKVIKPGPEFTHAAIETARAFREDDERMTFTHGYGHLLDRIVLPGDRFPRDEQGIEDAHGNAASQRCFAPVVARGDRPGFLPDSIRQGRPERGKVEVTSMIGEIDSESVLGRLGADPHGIGSRDKFGKEN